MVAWVPAAAAAAAEAEASQDLGGGGPIVHEATGGQDIFNGTNGVQDTFVFTLGQGKQERTVGNNIQYDDYFWKCRWSR